MPTLGPDGPTQKSVVWIARESDTAVFTITHDKQKVRNLAREPRISVTVVDSENGYNSAEIRGTAELVEDPGKTLSKTLSHKVSGHQRGPQLGH